jgi:predicted molibdopterin-dependent oxidoreductase YjgC
MDEIAEMTPRYAGLSHERMGRHGQQWPVAADGTDSPILYTESFELPGGKAQFAPLPYTPPGDEADEEFPLILVTGRRLEHYNAGTMTRRTGNLDLMPSDWLEVHPDDATSLGLTDGDVVKVRSRRGKIELPVKVTSRIEPGHVFTAFHFPEVRTNLLVGDSADINTSCPEYKVIAVAVERTGAARPVGERVDAGREPVRA